MTERDLGIWKHYYFQGKEPEEIASYFSTTVKKVNVVLSDHGMAPIVLQRYGQPSLIKKFDYFDSRRQLESHMYYRKCRFWAFAYGFGFGPLRPELKYIRRPPDEEEDEDY